jgi:hypothetical protein
MINQIFTNLTKHKQIFAKGQKTKIELFIIYHNVSLLPVLHCIIMYLFANIPFKFSLMGSVFMINDDENDKLFI